MVDFKNLNLALKSNLKVIKINNLDVTVKQYLSAEDKNSILEIAMQQADQGTILNTFALDAIFHVYLVLKYTDIVVPAEDMQDLLKLYDILETNEVIDKVVAAIPEEEYTSLRTYLTEMVNNYLTYRNSARALFEQISLFAPQTAEQLQEIANNFDVDKFQQIVKLADRTGQNNVE